VIAALLLALAQARPSAVVVLIDDVGSDMIDATLTPTIASMQAEGFTFTNAWAAPSCSPTRAALLTGRYGHRTGIGQNIGPNPTWSFQSSETTIAERVRARGYATGLIGKWHLGQDLEQPCDNGFQTWTGTKANLGSSGGYYAWPRVDDTPTMQAVTSTQNGYSTTDLTDLAVEWIGAQSEPYFLLLNYNAAHVPEHCPPASLQSECTGFELGGLPWYRGMVQSVDTELARLLGAVDRTSTTVIVLGDNGTPTQYGGGKGSMYSGGIDVPFVVWGAAVDQSCQNGDSDDGHANVVDVYRTVLRLLPGSDLVPQPQLDSVSLYGGGAFRSVRGWNFIERFEPLGAGPHTDLSRACEQNGFKAIWTLTTVELYDVVSDPGETVDLLADGIDPAEQAILDGLEAIVVGLGA